MFNLWFFDLMEISGYDANHHLRFLTEETLIVFIYCKQSTRKMNDNWVQY